ncbi:bromodomain, NET domain protein [Artemisia annua]|uniref:Bromodomain, NET domain protein n=1 Tax=Artemisia annua TaxID=35608 RepID=A0A2U1QAF4_ARTAN|nr:bromodomain, NET domain protein [Artemisia annua]
MDSQVLLDADKINKRKSTSVNLVYTRRPKKPKTTVTATPVEAVEIEPVIEPANDNHETLVSDNNGPSSSGQSQHHENGVVLFKQQQQEPLVSLVNDRVKICLTGSTPKPEINDLKGKLEQELEQVRQQEQPQQSPTLLHYHTPPVTTFNRRSFSRVSSDTGRFRHLTVSVTDNEYLEKEKRTPKANHLYSKSDFLLAKDRLPPESNKRPKPSTGLERHKNQVFRSCSTLLQRLMKHKHGWVFNEPVNAKLLGLHDYHDFIKRPMDLGTIKSRLAQNFYKVPSEFAEDVRLTFNNAMTYNPRGHEVYAMAEQLLSIFEEKWGVIESDWNYGPSMVLPKPATLDRSQSMGLPRPATIVPFRRTPVPKKPKAREPNKRDMTFDEKRKLSSNLQSLPSDHLDGVVQIIKKNNTVSQNDEEIEIDIDSVDIETLWELDRYVMNYRKNLSKVKRRAEIQQARALAGNDTIQNPVVSVPDAPNEKRADEQGPAATAVNQGENRGDNGSRSTSSSSSSSDSSSSDSDSDSSSEEGSPRG